MEGVLHHEYWGKDKEDLPAEDTANCHEEQPCQTEANDDETVLCMEYPVTKFSALIIFRHLLGCSIIYYNIPFDRNRGH